VSEVKDELRMPVAIYLELAEGGMHFLGRAKLAGNTSVEQRIPLRGLKARPRRALLSYYGDALASPSENRFPAARFATRKPASLLQVLSSRAKRGSW
jgi:hypothetical protein